MLSKKVVILNCSTNSKSLNGIIFFFEIRKLRFFSRRCFLCLLARLLFSNLRLAMFLHTEIWQCPEIKYLQQLMPYMPDTKKMHRIFVNCIGYGKKLSAFFAHGNMINFSRSKLRLLACSRPMMYYSC